MASFERSIPPGKEGQIKLTLRTKNYEGFLFKSALVRTTDPAMPEFTLNLLAFVKTPISLFPPYVSFYEREKRMSSVTVVVEAGLEKPLTLSPGDFSLDGKVAYTLEEVEKGKRFEIRITDLPGPPDNYRGYLNLETNYPEKPVLNIRIIGRFVEDRKASGP